MYSVLVYELIPPIINPHVITKDNDSYYAPILLVNSNTVDEPSEIWDTACDQHQQPCHHYMYMYMYMYM